MARFEIWHIILLAEVFEYNILNNEKCKVLNLRGCRLETIMDKDPSKSNVKLFFEKVLMQIIFIFMLIEEYQKILATL